MNDDISRTLADWPMSEDGNVRKIVGDDGREKIQVRVCIDTYHGILQFECDGRPDARRPHDHEFALDYYEARAGEDDDFLLDSEEAEELFLEAMMTYQRYVVLLQIGDFERVIRDTERNMRLFQFVNKWAESEADRTRLEKWWPYIIRIHFTARAMVAMGREEYDRAREEVKNARRWIDALPDQDDEVFLTERKRSRKALNELENTINTQRPMTPLEQLEQEKEQAVENEEYERAARLRDQIANLRQQNRPDPPPESN